MEKVPELSGEGNSTKCTAREIIDRLGEDYLGSCERGLYVGQLGHHVQSLIVCRRHIITLNANI